MTTALREWGDMVLSQMALGAFPTVGTTMLMRCLQLNPLRVREVIDRSATFAGTACCPIYLDVFWDGRVI